jgi:VanZ family protein
MLDKLAYVVRTQQHKAGAAATIVALLLVARLTLYPSVGPLPSGFHRCVLCGTFGLADFIDNVILFVPLGFALRLAGVRRRTAWIFMLALAIGIETAQDWIIAGRESSLSDIISNPLGGAVGILLADFRGPLLAPPAAAAALLARSAALALVLATALLAWAFQRSIGPAGPVWTQVASRLPQYVPFKGAVLDATIDDVPVTNGRVDSVTSDAMRAAVRAGTVRLHTTMVPAARADRISPLITVYDRSRRELLIVGCRQGHFEFRAHTRSDEAEFHPIAFQSADGCVVGDTTTALAEPLPGDAKVRLTTDTRGRRTVSTQGPGLWLGWHLLVPNDGWWSDLETPLTFLWMAVLLAPIAYWRARTDRELGVQRGVTLGFTALIVAALGVTLALIPLLAGSILAPPVAWLGALGGAALGWFTAQWRLA